MPSYWVNVKHLNIITTGSLTALTSIIGFLFMNFAGVLLDKVMVGKERILPLYMLRTWSNFYIFDLYCPKCCACVYVFNVCQYCDRNYLASCFYIGIEVLTEGIYRYRDRCCQFWATICRDYCAYSIWLLISVFNGSYIAVFGSIVATSLIAMVVAATINTKKILKDSMEEKAAI